MTVKFRDPLSAQACVLVSNRNWTCATNILITIWDQKMNGRYFDKRRVGAELFTGRQRFKRSGAGDEIEGEGEDADRKRLDDFAKWIMTEGD